MRESNDFDFDEKYKVSASESEALKRMTKYEKKLFADLRKRMRE